MGEPEKGEREFRTEAVLIKFTASYKRKLDEAAAAAKRTPTDLARVIVELALDSGDFPRAA